MYDDEIAEFRFNRIAESNLLTLLRTDRENTLIYEKLHHLATSIPNIGANRFCK